MKDNSGDPVIAGSAKVDFATSQPSGASAGALDDARRRIAAEAQEAMAPKKGKGWPKGRPRGRRPQMADAAAGGGMAPTMEQWASLIDALKHNSAADQEMAALFHAQAMKKALRPENEVAPGVSAYNPTGGVRPVPNGEFYLSGWPAPGQPVPRGGFTICTVNDTFTVTNTEITLLNQLKAGTYAVTKADGTETKAGVVQHLDLGGKVATTVIMIQIADDEQKNNWPPLVQLLTEILTGESPTKSFARMQAQIRDLETKLAASSAA